MSLARPLLGLELVNDDRPFGAAFKIFIVQGQLPPVHLGVIAPGRLQRRRELHQVDIARLHFCLHEKVQHPVKPPGDDAQDADLGLADNRLLPGQLLRVIGVHRNAVDGEKFPRHVRQVAGDLVKGPVFERGERDLPDRAGTAGGLPGKPLQKPLFGEEGSLRGHG